MTASEDSSGRWCFGRVVKRITRVLLVPLLVGAVLTIATAWAAVVFQPYLQPYETAGWLPASQVPSWPYAVPADWPSPDSLAYEHTLGAWGYSCENRSTV